MKNGEMHDLVVAMTGASGAIYAVRLLEVLLASGRNVHLTISPAAVQVLRQELGLEIHLENFAPSQLLPAESELDAESPLRVLRSAGRPLAISGSVLEGVQADAVSQGRLIYYHYQDFSAGIASGSCLTGGMAICPCSMGTLGSLANGLSANLIHRAADVHLKERRRLVVVPRETPLSSIQLENMRCLVDAGAVVLPAMPGFYHNPTEMHDLVDFIVSRICDQLGVPVDLFRRWGA